LQRASALLFSNNTAKTNVQERGRRLLDQLHDAKDKTYVDSALLDMFGLDWLTDDRSDRNIATAFLELPPRDEIPDYYNVIKLPIALSTIEDKLDRNAYPTMTTLESDLKRMVQNAKEYNEPKSLIFEDAERIRKLVYNFMKQHNPQYSEDPNYVSFATPISQAKSSGESRSTQANATAAESARQSREVSEKPRKIVLKNSEAPSDRKASVAPSATTGDGDGDVADADQDGDLNFEGMGLQEAQQKILNYLLHYTEDDLEIFAPFANLPSRKLEDYYQVIKHPVSIKGVLKLTKGIHGRAPPTGVTDFKTWDQFAEEVSCIWRNAQHYNETGSDMYNLADEFKDHFQSLLTEAKEKVNEPSGPRIKLGGPKPKVTLNLSQNRDSPAPASTPGTAPAPAPASASAPTPTPAPAKAPAKAPASAVSVDNEALQRQKQMVASAGTNGQRPTTNGSARSSSQVPTIEPRPQSSTQSGTTPETAIKSEKVPSQSPALASAAPAVQPPQTNGTMPPPSMRPPSGSPYPNPSSLATSYNYTAPSLLPPTALRPYPVEAALLPTVTVSTHPQLNLPKRFTMSVGPHPTLSQQSTTITLPPTHYYLQIAPTISKQLSMGRPYKMFVTLNSTRLNQRDTQFHSDTGKRTHVYEGSLAQGVNRIEVEVAASKQEGEREDERRKEGLDVEKVTWFVNLLR
ncbi:Bromodomain-containing protein, partial [Hortaea werneckii]